MLEPPELVTLLPEEEQEEPPVSEDIQIIKRLAIDVAVVVGAKLLLVFAVRRLNKTIREVGKLDIPRPRYPN